ncbi:MAG: 2OG-Fe(II) oxygenase [Pseudomonadota bacterium]|nr:2OG-Fe(II) oxygenase [Pseudomonadota bacterium]
MTRQPITTELRRWIVEQNAAGHAASAIVDSMVASGWQRDVAGIAYAATLHGAEEDGEGGDSVSGPISAVPGGHLGATHALEKVSGHEVRILAALRQPRVVVLGELLSAADCSELIALAQDRLARSETVETRSGTSEVNAARTSDGMFFEPAEYPVCARLEARIAELVRWPLENGEGLQVLRYRPGTEYKPHYDYFDPAELGTPLILERGGQRVASLICYLNTPEAGGATVFPDAGLEVAPLRGNAVFFSYDRPHPLTGSLHGGAPVEAGEKWVATKWMRQGRFT